VREVPEAPATVATPEEAAAPGGLPALDELVPRVPAGVRDALDDLFRAKFTAVRRVSPKNLNRAK
jgi:hypothetical protein